jgi:hypothetical protein
MTELSKFSTADTRDQRDYRNLNGLLILATPFLRVLQQQKARLRGGRFLLDDV